MTTLALIPARGGSKGVPRKNIASLAGKPLIGWTIEAAQRAEMNLIVVSTDDQEIADVSRSFGAQVVIRSAELSDDKAATLPVVLHALKSYACETVVLLQPTSPLRTSIDIKEALRLHKQSKRPVVSVSDAKPWLFSQEVDGTLASFIPTVDQRQSSSIVSPNGAIYVANATSLTAGRTWWDNAVGYQMPADRSIDIDYPHDFVIAEALLARRRVSVTASEAEAMALI